MEMRANLPIGPFSPFDFEREFQTRHGVRPEDADKSRQISHSTRESTISTASPDQETRTPRTGVPFSTTSTRDVEIIRTPGAAKDQEYIELSLIHI